MSPFFTSALLLEDEMNLARTLTIALQKLGVPTEHATTLAKAREVMSTSRPDLVILDRILPDGDGIELCREFRQEGFQGSILILTARGQVEDRVDGLQAGADDYLPKPFSWDELSARISALARRQFPASSARTTESPWTLEPDRLRIQGPKGWVDLTPLEFKLAAHLIDANGSIVSRDELLKYVWGFTLLPKTRTVDHFLGRLRKRFEINPENPQHFITVRGAGYRFER